MTPPSKTRVLISCGESSGDLYAAELVRQLRGIAGDLEVIGLGGDRLQAEGASLLAHVRDLAVIGLLEVVRHLRRLRFVFRAVLAEVDRVRPDLAILVDYPDFNLRLARQLKNRGIPVVYYVSPQVWAWRAGRIDAIRRSVAHMLVIFPFEEEIYRAAGVAVTFVGHPLVELVQPATDRRAFLAAHGLDPDRPLVAVLPGSRAQEVGYNLPAILASLRHLRGLRPEVQAALAIAPGLGSCIDAAGLREAGITSLSGHTHALLGAATAGIVASGTATVEAALLGLPMVVVYRLSTLTYALGRPFVRVPHYAMANLIAGREVVKELIQSNFRPELVTEEILRLLSDGPRRSEVVRGLAEVRIKLGGPGASSRAAAVVAQVLSDSRKKLDTMRGYM